MVRMDKAALAAFMVEAFPQVADDFAIEEVGPDRIVLRMAVRDRHLRPGGTVSGPSLFALADVAIYLALLAMIGPQALAVTTNCAIDFMRKPAAGVDLICQARLLKRGKRLAVGDALIFSEGQAGAVARAGLTYAIPPGSGVAGA